ncbi:MAG: Hint domain-containing protein [Myxococcaceae bacterium]|nr:Hint domain-containing protein [Myxococcaceae bacterium]
MKRLIAAAAVSAAFASCSCLSCISRGSRVRTPRGERNIEDLAVGDEVLCVDPSSSVFVAATLTHIRVARRECVSLGFGAGESLVCTSDHPLYCPVTREWAPAGDWALGRRKQLLRAEVEGVVAVAVSTVSTFAGVHDVFDLTVDHPLHDFVANGVVVHNKSIAPQCAAGNATLQAATSCGSDGPLGVEVTRFCEVTVTGAAAAGLPSSGFAFGALEGGFSLQGRAGDAGLRDCDARPEDGGTGFKLTCDDGCNGKLSR